MSRFFTSLPFTYTYVTTVVTLLKTRDLTQRKAGAEMPARISRTTDLSHIYSKDEKSVVFLSTMNKTAAIDQDTMKPESIQFHNKTKGGVETLKQLCHKFCIKKD
jgi:hypothetical protein